MKKRILIASVGIMLTAAAWAGANYVASTEEKPEIKTETIAAQASEGRITDGVNSGSSLTNVQTTSSVTYESPEIPTTKPQSNAAVLHWDQTDGAGHVEVGFRTFDGQTWSGWTEATPANEAKDNAPAPHTALVLANEIHKIQYRFNVESDGGQTSPGVNLADAKVELIDSTTGPSPTKKNAFKSFLQNLGFGGGATARADGPRIYSRAEWGSPEPNGSPSWEPEYREIHRVIVHHTATTADGDPAASIRAIWHHHAVSNGWGDIGYNYLVDAAGNIYQGRYYDPNYAETNRVDVVGGHALTWNYGSVGIASIANYSNGVEPSEAVLKSIGNIAAFKIHRYDINPGGFYGEYPVILGHRDVLSTACPGGMHDDLPSIRTFAAREYAHYNAVDHLDAWGLTQGKNGQPASAINMVAGETAQLYIDYRNVGRDTWHTSSQYPIRLGTKNPRDRASAFSAGWLSSSRPGSFTHKVTSYNQDGTANLQSATSIAPGETARFSFNVTAPEQPGTYTEYFQPLAEGYAWFIRDFNVHFTINVAARNFSWEGVEQKVYTDQTKTTVASHATLMQDLRGGQRYYVVVKVKNTGNQTWRNDGPNPVRLATNGPQNRMSELCSSWANCARPATLQESTVAPGGTGTFEFWVEMPYFTHDRNYQEYFNLVAEGLRWFPDLGMYWWFGVKGENLTASLQGVQGYTDSNMTQPVNLAQVSRNQRVYVVAQIKNDGNVTWQNSGARNVRIGTQDSQDRASAFCDSTWLNPTACNRVVGPQSSVAPGATGTFAFWAQAPNTAGTYNERVNLVAEGFAWFANPNMSIPITVVP